MPFELFVALRFLREGRTQTALILAGATVGVAVMIFITALIGGLFVAHLAYEGFRTDRLAAPVPDSMPQSLSRGALVNLLSPHPYLFWLTVGAPTILKGWAVSPLPALAFVAGFLGCLVGAKVVVAVLAGRSRQLLNSHAYGHLMRVLAVGLLVFAVLLVRDGLGLLGLR